MADITVLVQSPGSEYWGQSTWGSNDFGGSGISLTTSSGTATTTAAANVTVTSDGMMEPRELGQDRADTAAYIGIPDGSIGSGQRVLAFNYQGSTAKSYDWTSGSCS